MTDLTVAASFTFAGTLGPGEPRLGLTLAEIDLWLEQVDRATGARTQIWDGTQNPDREIPNIGSYQRIYGGADLDANNYFAVARYDGATTVDQNWITGSFGADNIPLGSATNWPYQVTEADDTPIDGVKVEIHRNIAGTDIYWVGWTNAFGFALDLFGNAPRLDGPNLWYFFRSKGGVVFNNPDIESVP